MTVPLDKVSSSTPRIVVLFPEFLGDYVMLSPMLYAFKQVLPNSTLDIYTSRSIIPLVSHHPAVDGVFEIPRLRGEHGKLLWVSVLSFIRLLKTRQYDFGYFTNDELVWILKFSGVRTILKEHATLLFKWWCKGTPAYLLRDNLRHMTVRHIQTLEHAFHVTLPPSGYELSLGLPESVLTLPAGFSLNQYIVINPDCVSIKNFNRGFYTGIIDFLVGQGRHVVIVGLRDPYALGDAYDHTPLVTNLVGDTSLFELCAVIRSAELFIGMDSGTSHIASSFGVKALIAYPPKGANPYLNCGFHPDHYPYRKSPLDSGCDRVCTHYPSCPYDECTQDYDVTTVCRRIVTILDAPKRSFEEKEQDILRHSLHVLIVTPDGGCVPGSNQNVEKAVEKDVTNPSVFESDGISSRVSDSTGHSAGYSNGHYANLAAMLRQEGLSFLTISNRKISAFSTRKLRRYLAARRILVVQVLSPTLLLRFRFWNWWFRITQHVYVVFLSTSDVMPIVKPDTSGGNVSKHASLLETYVTKLREFI